MFKLAIVVLCAVAAANAGIVSPITRCGGVGTPLQLRVDGCEGRCSLIPGTRYNMEGDLIPSSSSPSLTLIVDVIYLGISWPVLETVLENSSVQPGLIYTVKFSMVPNDILSGNTVFLRALLLHSDTRLQEICVSAEVDILA